MQTQTLQESQDKSIFVNPKIFFNQFKENEEKLKTLREKGGSKEKLKFLERKKGGIRKAMKRIKKNVYTICTVCGEDISLERLGDFPLTDRCALCASE